MSEEPPARKRYRSDESSDESLSRKPKFQASPSGLQCGSHLQQSIDESIRQLSVYQSDLRRGCVASMGRILAILDAMRAEIIGSAANDKVRRDKEAKSIMRYKMDSSRLSAPSRSRLTRTVALTCHGAGQALR